MDNLFIFNHLADCESPVTGMLARQAMIGAAVEFSARAIAGFARD
jgi:hypothetical protein